jgi:flagellar motility protein MotE (MotC chaperone)
MRARAGSALPGLPAGQPGLRRAVTGSLSLPLLVALAAGAVLLLRLPPLLEGLSEAAGMSAARGLAPLAEAGFGMIEPAAGPSAPEDAAHQPPPKPQAEAAPLSCPATIEGLEDVAVDLVQRRARLGEREQRLDLREAALVEAEKLLAQGAAELDRQRAELTAQETALGEQDEARIAQLAKVYEAMKPKQAAEVFEGLDLRLLVAVTQRMREAKVAAVLAAMSPAKAQRLTTELASRRASATAATKQAAAKP